MGTENTKYESGVVIVKTNNGDYHQVALNKEEIDWVFSLIGKLHEGEIRILETKLDYISF